MIEKGSETVLTEKRKEKLASQTGFRMEIMRFVWAQAFMPYTTFAGHSFRTIILFTDPIFSVKEDNNG